MNRQADVPKHSPKETMEHLNKRAEDAIDRLIRFARGDKALVSSAVAKYNSGEIRDLIAYIDKHRPKRQLAESRSATSETAESNTIQ